jgi:hypothetical protein
MARRRLLADTFVVLLVIVMLQNTLSTTVTPEYLRTSQLLNIRELARSRTSQLSSIYPRDVGKLHDKPEEMTPVSVPNLIKWLGQPFDLHRDVQHRAIVALAAIFTSGASSQRTAAITAGAVPGLVRLLKADDLRVSSQACQCLGDIAAKSPAHREAVLAAEPAWGQRLVELLMRGDADLTVRANCVRVAARLCHGPLPLEMMMPLLPALAGVLWSGETDEDLLQNTIVGLAGLVEADETYAAAVLALNRSLLPRLVDLLPTMRHQIPAMRLLGGCIVTAGDSEAAIRRQSSTENPARSADLLHLHLQIQPVFDAGLVPALSELLDSNDAEVRQRACWVLLQIVTGTPTHAHRLDKIVSVVEARLADRGELPAVKELAMLVLANLESYSVEELLAVIDAGHADFEPELVGSAAFIRASELMKNEDKTRAIAMLVRAQRTGNNVSGAYIACYSRMQEIFDGLSKKTRATITKTIALNSAAIDVVPGGFNAAGYQTITFNLWYHRLSPLLELNRFDEAAEASKKVIKLAVSWFHYRGVNPTGKVLQALATIDAAEAAIVAIKVPAVSGQQSDDKYEHGEQFFGICLQPGSECTASHKDTHERAHERISYHNDYFIEATGMPGISTYTHTVARQSSGSNTTHHSEAVDVQSARPNLQFHTRSRYPLDEDDVFLVYILGLSVSLGYIIVCAYLFGHLVFLPECDAGNTATCIRIDFIHGTRPTPEPRPAATAVTTRETDPEEAEVSVKVDEQSYARLVQVRQGRLAYTLPVPENR